MIKISTSKYHILHADLLVHKLTPKKIRIIGISKKDANRDVLTSWFGTWYKKKICNMELRLPKFVLSSHQTFFSFQNSHLFHPMLEKKSN